jgi:HD superfamily phosphohydrolase
MLKKSLLELNHPCFGKIRFDEKFIKVLDLKPFRDLATKSQLGTKSLSRNFVNAKHTRFLHSIGVYYLTSIVLEICEKKFSNYLTVTQKDKEVLLLAALGHDIGHIAFSHSLEDPKEKTHEQKTVELFREYKEQINDIFGYDITSLVIRVYQRNNAIKKQGKNYKIAEKLDILFIFSSLLIGTIDCDRMEYVITDRYMVYGEKLDYKAIFDYMTIVLLNNSPTVGFEREALPIIESLLLNRFEQYEQIYYDEDSTLIEMELKEYARYQCWSQSKRESLTEYQILTELDTIVNDSPKAYEMRIHRLAEVILLGERKNILLKKFTDKAEYEYFLDKIYSITGSQEPVQWIRTYQKINTIYNPKKNRVYIKDDDGVVKDITEISLKITDLSINYYYILVDVDPKRNIDAKVSENLKALFYDNPVEIEKKFVIDKKNFSETEQSYLESFEIINKICGIPGVTRQTEGKEQINNDQYFIPLCPIPAGMAMRLRSSQKEKCYYIKFPADDGTSIAKREEERFPNCSSLEEFLPLAEKAIKLKGYQLEKPLTVKKGVNIVTKRIKVLINVFDSMIELAYDISTYHYNGDSKQDFMLECELKKGDDLALWYLAKYIKNMGYEETNESKQTRAQKALNLDW